MSETTGEAPELDRELGRDQVLATVLRGGLAVLTGEDDGVSARLGEVAVALADETEVVRLDASQAHTASALAEALARALGLPTDDLVDELLRRSETLPLALVIDNGECLGSRALTLLRNLLGKAPGGLGVVVGGEAELGELLRQAGLTPACTLEVEHGAEDPDATGPVEPAGWMAAFPWKHLAAVVGLLVLVVLFWPGGREAPGEASSELELPPPQRPAPEPAPTAEQPRPDQTEASERDAAAEESDPPAESTPDVDIRDRSGQNADTPDPGTSAPDEPGAGRDAAAGGDGLNAELAYRSEDWLLTRPPRHWMLQLALAADEERARVLLDRLGRDRGAYYRARRNNEVVYIVLAGPFGSRGQALGARSDLPAWFRERGPFPRPIRQIASEIRD